MFFIDVAIQVMVATIFYDFTSSIVGLSTSDKSTLISMEMRNKTGFTEELYDNKDDAEPQLLGEIMEAVADIADMHINVPNLTLEQREAMLNVDEKKFLKKLRLIL